MKKGLGRGLGKGLDALISHAETAADGQDVIEANIKSVKPNADQPRKYFKQPEIDELAASIKEFGIIQPLIVKKDSGSNDYIIIAGERRWRAANAAGLEVVPVIVRDYSEMEILGIALIENIQREDLNPIEEAMCYKRLNEEFGMTQEQIATKIGKSRSHITNSIRVLRLDERVLAFIAEEKLSMGHAKALLSVENDDRQTAFAQKMIDEGMNVRQAEELVRTETSKNAENEAAAKKEAATASAPRETISSHFQKELRSVLGTRINIKENKAGNGGGKIEINYFSADDLTRIVEIIKNEK
ncbi:MAG: ParB/RepB/Spo0J family partition protein [Defluviitaleaceae bacterium]|nr:ParB/RepB/Spo0J family partition protein [Defluviitaleaceae bacterium]